MRTLWTTGFAVVASGCIPHLYSDGADALGPWTAPDNDWGIASPPAELAGTGFEVGQTAPDVRLVDQFGAEVSLWQFYGSVVLLDVSTMWCGPCQNLGESTEEVWSDYRDDGFVYLTVLQENLTYGDVTTGDLNEWADTFGISAPVLNDTEKTVPIPAGYPTVSVIGRDMRVFERVNPPDDDSVLRGAIEAAL
ncbi:MAG: TlpA disulfide reductase family protein [Myxococcota bacterium]